MKNSLISALAALALAAPAVLAAPASSTNGDSSTIGLHPEKSTWEGQIEQLIFDEMGADGRISGAKQVDRLRTADGTFVLKGYAEADRAARLRDAASLAVIATTPGQVTEVSGTLQSDGTIAVSSVAFQDSGIERSAEHIVSKPITIIVSVEEENDKNLEKIKKTMKQVAETFKTTSFGHKKVDLDANGDGKVDVYGAVKVDGDPKGCDQSVWSAAADEEVKAKYNVDFSLYNHRIYIFDKRYSCGWAGLAYLNCISKKGGGVCPVWMNTHAPGVILHEIAHNLAMHHAMKGGAEYGDLSDPMGSGWETFFNVAHTDQLNWFDGFDDAILDIESLNKKNTTVTIHPLTADNDGKLKAIRYNYKKMPFADHAKDSYYFGLRTAEGLDDKISKAHDRRTNYLDHLNVHTIFSQSNGGKTEFKTSIADGKSWSHPDGFTLTQQPIEGSKAKKITIEFK